MDEGAAWVDAGPPLECSLLSFVSWVWKGIRFRLLIFDNLNAVSGYLSMYYFQPRFVKNVFYTRVFVRIKCSLHVQPIQPS